MHTPADQPQPDQPPSSGLGAHLNVPVTTIAPLHMTPLDSNDPGEIV